MKKNKILSSFLLVILLYVWVCPAFAADSSIGGSGLDAPPELTLDDAVALMEEQMAAGASRKDAARAVSAQTGFAKNQLYDAALKR